MSYTAGYVLPKDATDDDPQTLPADLEGLLWIWSRKPTPACRTARRVCLRSPFPTSHGISTSLRLNRGNSLSTCIGGIDVSSVNEILVEFERLKSACRSMDGKKIVVGIVGDGVDSEVLKIAAAHEYGTDKLPERSFIRASFDADQDKLGSIVSGQVNKVLSGQISADAAANALALRQRSWCRTHRREPSKATVRLLQENPAYNAV